MKTLKSLASLAALGLMVGCASQQTQETEAEVVESQVAETAEVANEEVVETVNAVSFDHVYFDYDQSEISMSELAELKDQLSSITADQSVTIVVSGHADERGSDSYNLALGQARAEKVKSALIEQGIESVNIEVVSFGEQQPAVDGSDESAYQQNRRVEIEVK